MLIGYARVSADDQNLNLQRDTLQAGGCEKIFEDQISGVKAECPGLHAVLQFALPGETLVIWRLKDLITIVKQLESNEVGRPKILNKNKQALAVQLYDERKHTVTQICELMGVSISTLYKYIVVEKIRMLLLVSDGEKQIYVSDHECWFINRKKWI